MDDRLTDGYDVGSELGRELAADGDPDVAAVSEPAGPWGFWATVGFSAIITVLYLVACVVITVGFVFAAKGADPQADFEQIGESLSESGLLLAVAAIVTTPLVVGLCVLFAFCRRGMRVVDYLAVRTVSGRSLLVWLGALAGFIVISDTLTVLVGRPIVDDSMVRAYETSVFSPLLFFAIVICAPLAEEIFYRGFLFKGLRACPLGAVGATVVTSLVWAVSHLQYDWYGITWIFAGGLMLGAARIRTKSVLVPMAMHAMMNVVASAELIIASLF